MIIVSQDRMQIVNFENVNNLTIEGLSIFSYSNHYNGKDGTKAFLGKYKTIGRAKEVLQEIIEQYEYCQVLQEGHGISLSSGNNYVYLMPKE